MSTLLLLVFLLLSLSVVYRQSALCNSPISVYTIYPPEHYFEARLAQYIYPWESRAAFGQEWVLEGSREDDRGAGSAGEGEGESSASPSREGSNLDIHVRLICVWSGGS